MKIIFTVLIILSLLNSDEIKRLEAIVVEISQLRTNYEECKSELEVNQKSRAEDINSDLVNKIEKLEKLVKNQQKLLKSKEIVDKNQQKLLKSKEIALKSQCKKSTLESEKETFPKLIMKSEYQNKNSNDDTIINFKPITFHLIRDSIIYDAVDGEQIDKWEKNTSFTSGVKTENWVKITGYFVDRKWRRAQKEMWVELLNATRKNIEDNR